MLKGSHHSEEARRKMSFSQMGLAQHRGHSHSEATKRRISLAKMGQPSWMKGKTHTPEAVQRIREARARQIPVRGWRHRSETLALFSRQRRGRPSAFKGRLHTPEAKAKNAEVHRGKVASEESKQKCAESIARYMERWPHPSTSLEFSLYQLLREAGFEFCSQKQLGRYVVDAYLSRYQLVFEADGAFWHRDPEREAVRDAYLIDQGALAVIHLSEEDLKCV